MRTSRRLLGKTGLVLVRMDSAFYGRGAVHAALKGGAANAAWLVLAVIAFNLTRAAGTLAAPDLARATTATLRRKLITVPARVATSARRITLHLPHAWPWEIAWTALFDRVSDPPSVFAA